MAKLPPQHVVVPLIFPVLAKCRFSNDYTADRGGFLHAAIDIKAPKMSPVVAPFSGVVGIKSESFWIYGDNGWAMLGTHLNNDDLGTHNRSGGKDVMFAPNLVGGQHVYAGQFIGYVGMSGNATGPHLHFELYAPGRAPIPMRIRNPFWSLKYAQIIAKPRIRVAEARPSKREILVEGCIRRVEPAQNRLTLLLFAKRQPNGAASEVMGPHYVKLSVPQSVVKKAGGWHSLESINGAKAVTCYLPAGDRLDGAPILRLTVAKSKREGTRATRRDSRWSWWRRLVGNGGASRKSWLSPMR